LAGTVGAPTKNPDLGNSASSSSEFSSNDLRWIATLPQSYQASISSLSATTVASLKQKGTWQNYQELVTQGVAAKQNAATLQQVAIDSSNNVHGSLIALSLVPGPLGQAASGMNAAVYAGQGQAGNAAISAIGVIPAGTAASDSAKGLKAANAVERAAADAKPLDGTVTDGGLRVQATPNKLGAQFEASVQAGHDIGPKGNFTVNGNNRIADGMTPTTVSEVKNVATLSYTEQIADYISFAKASGRKFYLYVRPDTVLTGPLQQAVDDGTINLIRHSP
jgi:hypothetical protein